MKRDLTNNIALVLLKEPVDAVATDAVSSILDTADCDGVEVAIIVSALTGVDGSSYLTPVLQSSDTVVGTAFAAVAAADIIGGFSKIDATSEDSVIQRAGYIGHKRYLRVNFDYTGAGISAGIIGAVGILGYSKDAPVVAPAPLAAT